MKNNIYELYGYIEINKNNKIIEYKLPLVKNFENEKAANEHKKELIEKLTRLKTVKFLLKREQLTNKDIKTKIVKAIVITP